MRTIFKNTFLSILVMFISACVYSPWVTELYIDDNINFSIAPHEVPEKSEYENYYFNDLFTYILVKPVNEDLYTGTSPYKISIIFKDLKYETILLKSIKIYSNNEPVYKDFAISQFPIEVKLEEKSYTSSKEIITIYGAHITFEELVEFDVKSDSQIKIILELEDFRGNDIKMPYYLNAKIKKGLFKFIL